MNMSRLPNSAFYLALVAYLFITASAYGQPTTVYVYNHDPADQVNNNAEGLIFQSLGLLDANGQPISPIPEAQVIRDANNNIIGYRSADGTQEAYDVNSSATTDQAWQRVANGGTLHIVKHGAKFQDQGTVHQGGGVRLDGGQLYDGFGTGTGVGFTGGNYTLTARPGANITININACWSSNDPDGPGPFRPVTTSADGVPGVGSTIGHPVPVYYKLKIRLAGGTQAQRDAARSALQAAARAAGYPPPPTDGSPRAQTTDGDVFNWMSNLPFSSRYKTIQDIINRAVPPAGTVRLILSYLKDETPPPGGGGIAGTHAHPTRIDHQTEAEVTYLYDSFVPAFLRAPLGSLESPVEFQLNMLGELPTSPPAGHSLASGIFSFALIGGGPVVETLTIGMGFDSESQEPIMLQYHPSSDQWVQPSGNSSIDRTTMTALLVTEAVGTYAVFSPAPPFAIPTWVWLGLLLLLVLLAGIAFIYLRLSRRSD